MSNDIPDIAALDLRAEVDRLRAELTERAFGLALEKIAQEFIGISAADVHPDENFGIRWHRLRDLLAVPAAVPQETTWPDGCVGPHTCRDECALAPLTLPPGPGPAAPQAAAEASTDGQSTGTWPRSQNCDDGFCIACDRDYCRHDCHAVASAGPEKA